MKFALAASMLTGGALATIVIEPEIPEVEMPALTIESALAGTELLCHVASSTDNSVFQFAPSDSTECLPSIPAFEVPADCQQAVYGAVTAINATVTAEESPLGDLDVATIGIQLVTNDALKARMDKELKVILTSSLAEALIGDTMCLLPEPLVNLLNSLAAVAKADGSVVEALVTAFAGTEGGLDLKAPPKQCADEERTEFAKLLAQLLAPEDTDEDTDDATDGATDSVAPPPLASKSLLAILAALGNQGFILQNKVEFTFQVLQGVNANSTELSFLNTPQACPCAASAFATNPGLDSMALSYLSLDFVPVWYSALNIVDVLFELVIGAPGTAQFEATCGVTPVFESVSAALTVCKPLADELLAPVSALLFGAQKDGCYGNLCGGFPLFPVLKADEYDEPVNLTTVKTFIEDVDVNVFGGVGNLLTSLAESCAAEPPTKAPTAEPSSTGVAGSSSLSFAAATAVIAVFGFLERA